MKLHFTRLAALVACLGFFCTATVSAQRQRDYQTASDAAQVAEASLANYDTFGESDDIQTVAFNSGSGLGLGSGGFLSQPGQFYIGAEYLQVRATFSEATAFLTETQNVGPPVTNSYVFNQLDFDYGPSYRVYGGYRLCECGCDIQFGYTRLDSDASLIGIPGPGQIIVAEPEDVASSTPGTRIIVDSAVTAENFDLAFAKTIPLGGCCCGGCCGSCDCGDGCCDTCCEDTCCDDSCCGGGCGCGCLCCPAWDITWSAGVRYSEVDWYRDAFEDNGTAAPTDSVSTVMDFQGAGPRWGLEGRRYFGANYRLALFLKGDISLLLGDVGITRTVTNNTATLPSIITTRLETTQIIPVLDIVAGDTAYFGKNISVSGGYLFSAWHDLGMRDTVNFFDDIALQPAADLTFDDANILGFDGWFVRTEFAF